MELVDRATGATCEAAPELGLEVLLLSGEAYDARVTAAATAPAAPAPAEAASANADLDAAALLTNKKGRPLLSADAGDAATDEAGRVLLTAQRGRVALPPSLAVTDSSEAILAGRKPPFRLAVRTRQAAHVGVRPAISEAFVVATRRVRTSNKVRQAVQSEQQRRRNLGRQA